MANKNQKNQLNPFIRFSSIAIQMGLTIYLGSKLGEWIDLKCNNQDQLFYKIVTLLSVFIAMYSVIRQVLKITNNNSSNTND
jgi:membrane protein DedA with SNARE-associated domain